VTTGSNATTAVDKKNTFNSYPFKLSKEIELLPSTLTELPSSTFTAAVFGGHRVLMGPAESVSLQV
jgi:hypothetical protein